MTERQRLARIRNARRHLHAATGYDPNGGHYKVVDRALDALEADAKAALSPPAAWQSIGPVQPGGVSLLDMVLTHATSGIPLFPAVDTAWGGGGGVIVIAPEACTVDTKDTSSSPGEAIYVTGRSKIRLWIGHLDRDWPLGHKFRKGDVIGRTLPIPGKSDHAHIGVNVEAILGRGKKLLYGGQRKPSDKPREYTLGSPTIRTQLKAAA
jgi:hypothetical protein